MIQKAQAIQKMNQLGKTNTPFLFVIDYKMKNCFVKEVNQINNEELCFSINNFKNYQTKNQTKKSLHFQKHPITYSEYLSAFNKVQQNLHQGNSYLVNLTCSTPIETNYSLKDIFDVSEAKYKLLLKNNFVVFSPETFVKIEDGKISTYPMKGTIDAAILNAKQKILENPKEHAEHATIVDLLRNDLSKVAKNVTVEKFRYIERVKSNQKHLLQVSSKIAGHLPSNFNEKLGSILFELLPAGSISGAPKKKTLEIIEEAENHDRKFYTGIAGYYDGKNLDSFVMIRFIENNNGKLIYKSGGGITSQSISEDEYQELIDKIYVPAN